MASIHEAVLRRYQRLDETQIMPDILLIDGGKGQLHAAVSALDLLAVEDRPMVISLAKREELIFRPDQDEPLRLSRHSYALRLLQYVRDEAHRFAQHYHHILRRRFDTGGGWRVVGIVCGRHWRLASAARETASGNSGLGRSAVRPLYRMDWGALGRQFARVHLLPLLPILQAGKIGKTFCGGHLQFPLESLDSSPWETYPRCRIELL